MTFFLGIAKCNCETAEVGVPCGSEEEQKHDGTEF